MDPGNKGLGKAVWQHMLAGHVLLWPSLQEGEVLSLDPSEFSHHPSPVPPTSGVALEANIPLNAGLSSFYPKNIRLIWLGISFEISEAGTVLPVILRASLKWALPSEVIGRG